MMDHWKEASMEQKIYQKIMPHHWHLIQLVRYI